MMIVVTDNERKRKQPLLQLLIYKGYMDKNCTEKNSVM